MKRNFHRLILASAIAYSSLGIFTPAWYLFLSEKGGALQFGLALGVMSISAGITSFFIGKVSDMRNKTIILSGAYMLMAVNVILYIFASSTILIYLLQFFYGVLSAVLILIENVLASILTPPESRGEGFGLLSGVQQIVIGLSMIFGGGLAGLLGIHTVFITVACLLVLGGLVALGIKENPGANGQPM